MGDLNDAAKGNDNLQTVSLPIVVDAESYAFRYNQSLSDIQVGNLINIRAMNILDNPNMSQCEAETIYGRVGRKGIAPRDNDDSSTCI